MSVTYAGSDLLAENHKLYINPVFNASLIFRTQLHSEKTRTTEPPV